MTERQLRKALGAADELEPPTDELFAQRALQRGRTRMARRRNAVVGAAAGLVLVGAVGGGWVLGRGGDVTTSTAGSAADRGSELGAQSPATAAGGSATPQVAPERDTSSWLSGPMTSERSAFDSLAPSLAADYPEIFGGAYARDATNAHVVVTVTRRDAGLESRVSSAMPSPDDVSFEVVRNSAARKLQVAAQIVADASGWLAKGLPVAGVRVDARSDRVVVTVLSEDTAAAVEAHYGPDIVRAEVGTGAPLGVPSTGATLPTLQH